MSTTPQFLSYVSPSLSTSSKAAVDLRMAVMGHAVRLVTAAVAYQVYLSGGLSLRFTLLSLVDGMFIGLLAPLMALCVDHRRGWARVLLGIWNVLGAFSLAALTWLGTGLARDFPRDVELFNDGPHAVLVVGLVVLCSVSHALVAVKQVARRPA